MSRRSGTKGFILCSLVILLTFFSGAAFGASAVVENNSTNTTKYNNNPPIETTNTDRYGMWSRNGASVENAKKTGSYYDPNPTTISTEGNNSHGMVAQGYGKPFLITYYSKAFNYGSIITTGDEAYGMWATGGAEIHNEKEDLSTGFWKTELFTGSITTTGPGSHGMMAEGTGSKAWNSGTINTEGPNSYGMLATGGAEVHNFDWHGISASPGTITTEGEGSHGMAAEGTGSKAWNSGTIFTKGNGSYGMLATGGAEVHNFDWYLLPSPGTITTEGEGSHGMAAEGTGSKAWNSGTINTEGPNSYGMLATGGAEVHNFDWYLLPSPGTITTEGEGSHGMVAEGSGSQAWNGGNIATEKDHSYGMWATNGARVNSFYGILLGDIETKGFGSHGMVAEGSGSQAWNGGHIDTIGESAYGMWATGGAQAFNVGIHFDAWGLFTLDLGGNIETGGADSHGMVAEGSGSIVGNIGSSITTKGDGAFGMVASGDSIAANLGKVETQGSSSHGMAAHNFALALNAGFGEGSIIPGTIETTSGDAYGMWGHDLGLVVNAGEIDTEGDRSHGMVAQNTSVAVNFGLSNLGSDLLGGLLKTIGLGDLSSIVEGLGGGLPGEITTTGDSAHGMVARNWSAAINLSKIATHGENSFGMQAEDFGLALNMGDIATEKDGSHGMVAEDRSIAVNAGSPLSAVGNLLSGLIPDNLIEGIDLKTIVSSLFGGGSSKIETWGDDAHGMVARNWSAAINLDEIVTHGGNSYGMHAEDFGLALNMGQITTGDPDDSSIGTGSHGMVAEDRSIAVNAGSPLSAVGNLLSGLIPDNLIEGIDLKTIVSSLFGSGSSKIETWGDDAHGMVARNWSVAINLDEITTHGSGAHGMEAFDHSMITNVDTDSIETFGDEAFGMYAFHHSLGLNTGAITTHGLKSHGMVAKDDSLIINTGPIVTLNHGAVGMKAQMDSTALNLEGSIVTSGHGAHGMFAEDDSTAVSIGSIVTSGHGAVGMKAKNDSTAVSVGSIVTSGHGAHGMYAEDDSEAINIGSIVTSGHGAVGMKAKNDSFGLSVGSIITSGHGAHGMFAEDDSEAINIGSIITSGHGAVGVKAKNDSFGLSVGSIITSGHGAHGMYAEDESVVVNTGLGLVTTTGNHSAGMRAQSDSEALNEGLIITFGRASHGMLLGDGSFGKNSGAILTFGPDSDAVRLYDSKFVNRGILGSFGDGGYALSAFDDSFAILLDGTVLAGSHTLWGDDTSRLLVRMDDPTQTDPFSAQVQGFDLFTKRGTGWMTLEEGSFVDGHTAHKGGTLEIESQTQFTTNTYSQSLGSTLYVYMNPGSYTDNDEIPLWVEGDADIRGMLTIDASTGSMPGFYTYIRANDYGTSNFETEFVNKDPLFTYYMPQWIEVSSWHYTSMVGYSFSHAALGMVAAIDDWSLLRYAMANHLNDVADCMKQLEVGEKKIHAQVLAGQTKRDPSSATSAGFDSTQKGISLGFDKKQDDSTLWGLYVGYTEKDIDFTGLPMVYADWESQDTWHFGAYISKRWDKWILSDTLTYRRASHDTFRKQVGGDARASFDSWAVTNDLRLGYVAKEIGEGSHWQVIPEVGLNVGYINRGGYTEDNGFTYGDFSHTVVESVVGIRFKGEYLRGDGSTFIPQLRLGWAHILSGEDITIEQSWGGTTYSFTESLDRDYLVADLGLSLCKYGNMDLSLNYGGRFGSNSTTHGGWLRLEWKF